MSDKARAAGEELLPDDSEEQESWLRNAVRGPDTDSSAELPLRGEVIDGKYRIEELLGRGGMGAVFRATHVVSEKPVAIKWLLRAVSDDQARRRFAREARAVGRIDHPNVVDLYDVCQEGDRNYLVMQLLRGESLRKRLGRGPLDATAAVDLLLPVMQGVAAAHQAGVIHRDLKPDNIFLCEAPDGSPREAKVLDFGVSSITAAEGADATLTQAGALLGSPAYMSPEQLKSSHDVDARTDVYAFGVILYEVLAGARPFQAESYGTLIVAITNSDPKPLSKVRADLPPGLEQVVLRAFAREQTARYPNMASLIEALRPFGSR